MLGEVVAVGRHHAERAGLGPHHVHHLGNGVRDVVVAGAAEIREPTGDGEPAGIIERNAHLGTGDFDGRRKATVEVDVGDVGERHLRHLEGLARNRPHGRRCVVVVTVRDVPVIVRIGAAVQIDPFLLGNAERLGFGDRRQH